MLDLISNDDGSTPEKKKQRLTGLHTVKARGRKRHSKMETIFNVCT